MTDKKTIKLVEDNYFTAQNWDLKIEQTTVALISWLVVILPFICLALPVWQPAIAAALPFNYQTDILSPLSFLANFFDEYFVFIAIFYLGLTFWNNYQFAATWTDHLVVDLQREHERANLVEDAWNQKFGSAEQRENCSYYCVEAEQNLETDFAQTLFKQGEQ